MYKTPFKERNYFLPTSYSLLPFEVDFLDEDKAIITNIIGEYLISTQEIVSKIIKGKVTVDDKEYKDLKRNFFIYDNTDDVNTIIDCLSARYRTKNQIISNFTGLHIFVVSLRCEHSCTYCQVSRQNVSSVDFDMSLETATKAISLMFQSPSPYLKVEFQGGEPLLNFSIIKFIVEQTKAHDKYHKKDIEFVIATNLTLINNEILNFCKQHNILISTSLDGPDYIHNKNRIRPGNNSYDKAVSGIDLARKVLGYDKVGALMTTTSISLKHPLEIINEYLSKGFDSIFLRPISPYGFAIRGQKIHQQSEEWLDFYFKGLEYIISLNINGIKFREDYASIILSKIYGKYENGYVDLQNPAGIGIGAVVYNYDGKLYASDEGRMLKEMGEEIFCLGDIHTDSYQELFSNERFLSILEDSVLDSSLTCYQCAFKSYCGSDPVYHYATQKDFTGNKTFSGFCKKNISIFKKLISLYESDNITRKILTEWIR